MKLFSFIGTLKVRKRTIGEIKMESFIKRKAMRHRQSLSLNSKKDKLEHFYHAYNKSLLVED